MTWEVAEELNIDHSTVIWHLKQIGKMKKLNKWVPHELTVNKKIIVLKCHLLLFCATTMNHFLIGLWHAKQSGFYMTTDDDQLSGWTEKLQTWLLFGGRLPPVWSTMVFWILAKSQHLRSMLSKLLQKLNEPGLWSFASSAIFTWPLADEQPLLQASWQLLQGKCFHNQQKAENASRSSLNPEAQILCYRNKQAYFSLAKIFWLWSFLFWLIKMCLGIVTMI